MPTHRLSFLMDCSDDCKDFPNSCIDCLKNRLITSGIPFREFQAIMEIGKGQELASSRDVIHRKYQDVLNIKTILVLDKTGICLYNYPVTGTEMDGNLVAGFLQANISFSKEGVAKSLDQKSPPEPQGGLDFNVLKDEDVLNFQEKPAPSSSNSLQKIFELDYQNFVLAVYESFSIRTVLILEKSASFNLRNSIIQFTDLFEKIYGEALQNFMGDVTIFREANLIVEKVFETDLLFPYAVKIISPIEEEQLNSLEKMVYKYGLDFSRSNHNFFFISTILARLQQALQKPARDIVHSIYQLLEKRYFVPQDIELAAKYKAEQQEIRKEMDSRDFSFTSVYETADKEEFRALQDELMYISEKEGKNLLKKYLSTAASSWEYGIFDDAMKNFEKAKIVANGMNFHKDLEKIEKKMEEIFEEMRQLEYDNAMKIAVNAEKSKDFLKAVQNYMLCKELLLKVFNYDKDNKRIQQIEKRILHLQSKIE